MAILVILMFFRRINSVTRPKVLKLGFELSRKVISIYRLGPRLFFGVIKESDHSDPFNCSPNLSLKKTGNFVIYISI